MKAAADELEASAKREAALAARVAELEGAIDAEHESYGQLLAANVSLQARCDAAEKDAERYRWLKGNVWAEHARKHPGEFIDYNMRWQIKKYLPAVTAVASDVPFDEAIDAAILKEKEA